jgi:hypothetical protein
MGVFKKRLPSAARLQRLDVTRDLKHNSFMLLLPGSFSVKRHGVGVSTSGTSTNLGRNAETSP